MVETYFNSKATQFNNADRSILNQYFLPSLEVAGGLVAVTGSVAGATYVCAQSAGFGCYAAALTASAGFSSSIDHIRTGTNNFGKSLSKQEATSFVKYLKQQGLSEQTARDLQLAIDIFGTGAIPVASNTTNIAKVKTLNVKPAVNNSVKTSNGMGNGYSLTRYNPQYSFPSLLNKWSINETSLKSLIPQGSINTFIPSNSIKGGYKYDFIINGQKIQIKWRAPDSQVAKKYPNSNSGKMWTDQIKVGNKYLGTDGKFYRNNKINITHIPINIGK